jgi:hypothetical protein
MNKFLITERAGGFGDIFTNLMGTWIIAKYTNRNVIIDWRRNPYNWYCGTGIKDRSSGSYLPLNSFLTVFDIPKNLSGVNFYLPEHICDFGARNSTNNFWDYNDLKLIRQESKNEDDIEDLLYSDEIFIRNEIRYGTPCHGIKINMTQKSYFEENITLKSFFEHFKLNNYISDFTSFNEKNLFSNKKICGIHVRHGNNTEITNPIRYPNWIEDSNLVKIVKEKINNFINEDEYFFYICTDTEKINDLLLKEIPNSFSLKKDFSYENESCMLLNGRLNPISSFQEAFLDMYFLTRCSKLIYTEGSIFTAIPQCYYTEESKISIF